MGLPNELAQARQAPRENSVCSHVVASNEMLVSEDVLKNKYFANNAFLREHNIRFYAGVPLRSVNGRTVGTLCVIDTSPRKVSASEKALLQIIADQVMQELWKDTRPEQETAAEKP